MKKIIAILAVMALVIACFAACGGKTEPAATDTDVTAGEIVENPGETSADVLVMGTNAAFPPYEFVAEDGSYAVGIINTTDKEMSFDVKVLNFNKKVTLGPWGVELLK